MDDYNKTRARAALKAWDDAIHGDSGDAELEAGTEMADLLTGLLNTPMSSERELLHDALADNDTTLDGLWAEANKAADRGVGMLVSPYAILALVQYLRGDGPTA